MNALRYVALVAKADEMGARRAMLDVVERSKRDLHDDPLMAGWPAMPPPGPRPHKPGVHCGDDGCAFCAALYAMYDENQRSMPR